jgi:hypothetical protein
MNADLRSWCRGCGAVATDGTADCVSCHTPLDAPEFGPPRIGQVVTLGTRFTARAAVAVAEQDSSVLLLDRGDVPTPLAKDKFDRLTPVEFDAPVTGAAGRLWAAARAHRTGALKAKWSADAVDTIAKRLATTSLAARRAAAVDLAALGLPNWPELRLSRSEFTWYQAWTAALAGDVVLLVRLLEDLPATGYPGRVELLLRNVTELRSNDALAARAHWLLTPFGGASLDARALLAVLGPEPSADVLDLLRPYARTIGAGWQDAEAAAAAIAALLPLPSPDTAVGPAMRSLDAYIAGHGGTPLDDMPERLAQLPVPLLDRLVAAGAVTRVPARDSGWSVAALAHLRCRLDPGGADVATLSAAGFFGELARRAYRDGDEAQLARLPETDDTVRHYRALDAYRSTGRLDRESIRPSARPIVTSLDELALSFPGRRNARPEIAADPSTWTYLWRNATDGKIRLDEQLRVKYPLFASWLELCELHKPLWERHWDEVAAAGRRLGTTATVPWLRAEALNVAAYGTWQLGDPDEALRLLDRAMAIHPAEGQAVNASLIAAGRGCLAALPYLARVMQLTRSPRLRRGAVEQAIELWRNDGGVPDYPPTLAAMVRSELAVTQDDDEFHRMLLVICGRHDQRWLAEAKPACRGATQRCTARYHQAAARLEEKPSTAALTEVAAAVTALWLLDPRPEWAADNRAMLMARLSEVLSATADRAVDPAPAVVVLLDGDVLEMPQRVAFGVQAGACLAEAFGSRDQRLPTEVEQRLLVGMVRTFWQRRNELGEPEQLQLERVLANAIGRAASTIMKVSAKRLEHLGRRWKMLQRSPAPDYATGRRIARQQLKLVEEFEAYLRTCRSYLDLTDGLPIDEQSVQSARATVREWSQLMIELRRFLA